MWLLEFLSDLVETPSPVFLDDSRENVKLGDFGLSKSMGSAAFANTYVGTPYYMSPELFNESAYDAKSDIWALGCVIYEMVALQCVFLMKRFCKGGRGGLQALMDGAEILWGECIL